MADNLSLYDAARIGTLPAAPESEETDVYTLSLTYDHSRAPRFHKGAPGFGIATRGDHGRWINAVDNNFQQTKTFVRSPWDPRYGLGTYGVDPSTRTAWAVLDYNGDFAVAQEFEPCSGHHRRHGGWLSGRPDKVAGMEGIGGAPRLTLLHASARLCK
jgi:hypothetical protein